MQKKMRVLFLQSELHVGSTEDVHCMLMRHFNEERIEKHVACVTEIEGRKTPICKTFEAIPGLHIFSTNFGPPKALNGSKLDNLKNKLTAGLVLSGSMVRLIRYIKKNHINIIHTGINKREMFCALLLARLTGIKCIVHLHIKCDTWMTAASLWAMRQADGLIGVSQFTAQTAIEVAGCRPERVYHALNSVDISRWNCDTDSNTVRHEFGIAPNVLVFAIVARAVPCKGHEFLFQALSKIKNELPEFKLLVVGGDNPGCLPEGSLPPGCLSYIDFLKMRADDLGISQQVIFTGHRTDVQATLAASDLYTMPALDEAFGLVFLEALAMKKPVIALDSGGAAEAVEDGKSGLLSPPEDIEQFARNILTLANNPALRRQMGEYGHTRIKEYFNSPRMADDVEQIYQAVIGEAIEEPQMELTPEVVFQALSGTRRQRGQEEVN